MNKYFYFLELLELLGCSASLSLVCCNVCTTASNAGILGTCPKLFAGATSQFFLLRASTSSSESSAVSAAADCCCVFGFNAPPPAAGAAFLADEEEERAPAAAAAAGILLWPTAVECTPSQRHVVHWTPRNPLPHVAHQVSASRNEYALCT